MKHAYSTTCDCARCTRERARRQAQSDSAPRPAVPVRTARRNLRRERAEREYWDAFESGRPMSDDDY
jgi:hypothetical protein